MRVAHFDCFSGISGDMTLAALIDVGVDPEAIRAGFDSFGLPITMEIEKVKRNGLAATYVNIIAPEEQTHRYLPEVEEILNRGKLTQRQRDLALTHLSPARGSRGNRAWNARRESAFSRGRCAR